MEQLQQDQFLLPPPPPPPPMPWEATIFSSAVQQMVDANERSYSRGQALQQTPTAAAPFHGALTASPSAAAADGVDVEQYIGYIHSHFPECEPAGYVVAFVYIRRFLEKQESRGRPFLVTSSNFQRLVLLGIMLANKNLTQRVYWNADYAAVGGMSTAEMNELERKFLSVLSFDLHVDTEHYESCLAYLECTHRPEVVQQRRRRQMVDPAEEQQRQLLLARLQSSRLLG